MPPESAAVESSAGPRAGELPLELPSGATALAPLMLTGDFPLYLTVVAQPTPGENPSGCKKLDVLLAVGRDDPPG